MLMQKILTVLAMSLIAILVLMSSGCSTDFYVGAKTAAYYPDKAFEKTVGDPRKESFKMPQERSGVMIGGNHSGFKTIGGE